VTVPYWDWVRHPRSRRRFATARSFGGGASSGGGGGPSWLPTGRVVNAVLAESGYVAFRSDLEAIHGGAHNAVGGDMATARSPNDPLFWLHHANIDRLFAKWQESRHGGPRPSRTETLKPRPILRVKVRDVMRISELGYRYS
jgi:hypothetical protein